MFLWIIEVRRAFDLSSIEGKNLDGRVLTNKTNAVFGVVPDTEETHAPKRPAPVDHSSSCATKQRVLSVRSLTLTA